MPDIRSRTLYASGLLAIVMSVPTLQDNEGSSPSRCRLDQGIIRVTIRLSIVPRDPDSRINQVLNDDVSVTTDGVTHEGAYYVNGFILHVRSPLGAKATQVGGSSPEAVAKLLLAGLFARRGSNVIHVTSA